MKFTGPNGTVFEDFHEIAPCPAAWTTVRVSKRPNDPNGAPVYLSAVDLHAYAVELLAREKLTRGVDKPLEGGETPGRRVEGGRAGEAGKDEGYREGLREGRQDGQ